MTPLELTGRANSHIIQTDSGALWAERNTAAAFLEMKHQAAQDGIQLRAYSSYRSFDQQLKIWNDKFSGKRPLYSPEGKLLECLSLSEEQLIDVILSWSALPGGSRHHWGTDMDIIDSASIPKNYEVKLLPEEYRQGGVFEKLDRWLETHAESFGFFKPYREYKGGVCEEPWHLSYAPQSKLLLQEHTTEIIRDAISESEMLGKNAVLERLPELYRRFVINVCE